jgi:glycerophosphoryl diester phosphodiesterase
MAGKKYELSITNETMIPSYKYWHSISYLFILLFLLTLTISCDNNKSQNKSLEDMKQDIIPNHLVIAHRGTTYWAPEETEAAMRWARNTGVDYLEFDLQRTKDGYIIALHDENLQRTTDVAAKFPERKDEPVSSFTYKELLTLDAGTWFNLAHPERARKSFEGLDILTLEDVIMIAEGKRIKRNKHGKRITSLNEDGNMVTVYEDDPSDNGHRPGIYPETKVPALFPGIEQDLRDELIRLGWYNAEAKKLKEVPVNINKVGVANTSQRVILQTFSKESLKKLHITFDNYVPKCFLLWRGKDHDDLPDGSIASFAQWVEYAKQHGASIIGPSIGGEPNNYFDLLSAEHASIIKNAGLIIHPYSFDTWQQMEKYAPYTDGMFTNKAEETLMFYKQSTDKVIDFEINTPEKVLKSLGY